MNETIPADCAERIRQWRALLGLTQAQFAAEIGVSFASVNRWENGKARPSWLAWQHLLHLAERGERPPLSGVVLSSTWDHISALDFSSTPQAVRVVVEGERLSFGHLFSPSFATEISLIDPLPHQRIAVYERMLPQPCLRFLLADDAGAGKTIMAGLYIREMLSRRLIRRVLVVPPAGLVGNWRREMRLLFGLLFRIVSGAEARNSNPFGGPESDLLIVSVDTLAGDRMFARLQDRDVIPYDLVIFDEAHKLSADREADLQVRKTDRYRLAEALAGAEVDADRWHLGWHPRHMLLMTATPHMGKDFPYYCLWRLLEPGALSTIDAFNAYPPDARAHHFLRRTKEEMVYLDGRPLYPQRISDTLSYELSQGPISEQALYDQTTTYIDTFYNQARILNRSAARFAKGIFQRRLASSTYALLCSLKRRMEKLTMLIADIEAGRITPEQLLERQRALGPYDVFDEETADEEHAEGGREGNEIAEDQALAWIVGRSVSDLRGERDKVALLVELAQQVYDRGEESKFVRLLEVIRDPGYRGQKMIIFTEHRDTLNFIVRRLEALGYTGRIASIHGGLDFQEREAQVALFETAASKGGATYLVATDAAGEGINLQFCWLMVNYDIPWNPARLEQRLGRIHRYKQKHDPVILINLVAAKTREGRVMSTLLTKLEIIRKELSSDKVYDVIGRLFQGVSLRDYMELALTEKGASEALRRLNGLLTPEQVKALEERERRLFGHGGDVKPELPRLRQQMDQEVYRKLLPGYVWHYVQTAAPLMGIEAQRNADDTFTLLAREPGALDVLWPVLETYAPEVRNRLSVGRPDDGGSVFFHPGEPLYERFHALCQAHLGPLALRGGTFSDPEAKAPYLLHVMTVAVLRQAEPALSGLEHEEALDYRLIALRQEESGAITPCPVEQLLLLRTHPGVVVARHRLALAARDLLPSVEEYARERVALPLAEEHRQRLQASLPEREAFLHRGYDYEEAELAAARAREMERVRRGDPATHARLATTKERQRATAQRREQALARLREEIDLIVPGEVSFVAHALVLPSDDPVDKLHRDQAIEAIAMQVALAHEEALGARVQDVSKPQGASAAGLAERPGFDLLSRRPDGVELAIEVKGRAQVGEVLLSENEWVQACNLRGRYWLYVVYDCGSGRPQPPFRIQDPFAKLLVRVTGVRVTPEQIAQVAERD